MEEVKTREIKTKEIKHIFYCDGCKKELGSSIECDDGYYEERGYYSQVFFVTGDSWYKLHLNLCEDCKQNKTEQIINALLKLGFTKEGK